MLRALARLPFLAVRQLRWRKGAWSKDSDREYHEQLYDAQDHDAFRASYPGYVTIRRFADHADILMPAPTASGGTVLDIGCGPGEITCELARRHPDLSFLGIDHSNKAIQRATRNATRLKLANIRFEAIGAEDLPKDDRYALVLMFDAFHHLEQPRAFLTWLRGRTSRVVLIEPAGTWTGRWARNLDVDWLLDDLANIRDRLEALAGADANHSNTPTAAAAPPVQGEGAVERRYALDDFENFFRGWTLHITGTIAGFDRYPPSAHAESALRPVTGDLAYALVRATEDILRERDFDGAAKHWVIAATTEAGVIEPRLPGRTKAAVQPRELPPSRVASAYDVRYERYDGPAEAKAGEEFRATVGIRNAGWDEWRSDGTHPVNVCYHWLKANGGMFEFDGVRTHLPRALGPNESCEVSMIVRAPATAGEYVLAIDLVKEGVTWFSEAGKPWHTARVSIAPRQPDTHA